jgi:hypothetical protein
MKTKLRVANPESVRQRGLHLTHETIRTLSSSDLTQAVAGSCETGSLTTDRTNGYSLGCATVK